MITTTNLPEGKIKRIHVSQPNIRANSKHNQTLPVFSVKTSNKNYPAVDVTIYGPSRLVYQPEKPLSCGAKVWIETYADVLIYQENNHAEESN